MLLGYATHLRASNGDTMTGDERFDVERAERSARLCSVTTSSNGRIDAGRCTIDVEALFAASN